MSEVAKDMIGCLCWFWDTDDERAILSILKKIIKLDYCDETGTHWEHCRPVKPDEVKFYDYDDRYNCCAENEVLRLKNAELVRKIDEKKDRVGDVNKMVDFDYYDKILQAITQVLDLHPCNAVRNYNLLNEVIAETEKRKNKTTFVEVKLSIDDE